MALPDPIPTITVAAVTYDLARVAFGENSSKYRTANGLDELTISHQRNARDRTSVRFNRKKVAANPFDAAVNQEYSWSAYAVFDAPKLGVSAAECQALGQLLTAFLAAGTPDYDLRVLQGEI
jgi:hypothetical protein